MGCRYLIRIAILGAFTPVLGLEAELANALGEKPNIVIFISDDHGFLDTALAGAAEFHTPNLRRVAGAGMVFTHAFAASPSCAPSRAALLTGHMPIRNGAMLNHQPPRADVKKLPAYLHELGYEVVAFGKVAHYKQGQGYGFDYVSHDGFHDDQCVSAAVDFLKERSQQSPLCLLVGTNWPHVPWPEPDSGIDINSFEPPPQHVDTPATRRWRARYAAAVARFDRDLGLVYDTAFERLGPNTLFIHFSDHGAQWPFGKWNLYDAGTRVPFVVVWPEIVAADSRTEAMISLVDVLPTLIEAAGGMPPTDINGRSIKDALTGNRGELREAVFTTHSGDGRMNRYPMRSVRTREWKYIRNLWPERQHTTHIDLGKPIDGNEYWKSWVKQAKEDAQAAAVIERYHRRPAEELYHLRNDPQELHNLADDPAKFGMLNQLRAQLDNWMKQQADQGLTTENSVEEAFQSSSRGQTTKQAAAAK